MSVKFLFFDFAITNFYFYDTRHCIVAYCYCPSTQFICAFCYCLKICFCVYILYNYKMADKNDKINDEKRLIELVRKVLKEELAQQEKNISNLISGNFSITKQQIEEVKKEILDLRKSIEFTENQVEEKVNNAENKPADIEHRIEEIYDYEIDRNMSSRS